MGSCLNAVDRVTVSSAGKHGAWFGPEVEVNCYESYIQQILSGATNDVPNHDGLGALLQYVPRIEEPFRKFFTVVPCYWIFPQHLDIDMFVA